DIVPWCVDRVIPLQVSDFDRDSTGGPSGDPSELYLDAHDQAIVGVIDLRGNSADRSIDNAIHPPQKAGVIEIQVKRRLPGVDSLEHSNVLIVDGSRADSPLLEGLFDLRRKSHHSLNLLALQISSG